MESERQRLIEQIEGEGEEEAQKIRSEADKQTGILLAQAEAERKRLLGEGEAEAAQYYEVFERNPELARFLLKLEAFRQSLSGQTTLILDPTTPPFDMLDPVQSEKTRKAIAEGQVDAQSGKSPK
jgi:membrane protease subunit HflC